MLAILLISGAYLYRLSQRPLFDHTMLREIRETWNGDELFTSLRDGQGIDKQLLRLTESSKFLSPDYLPFLPSVASLGVEIKRVRRRYIQALSEFPEHERARALASAFLERPGETLLSGIALVSAARTYASHLAVKDFLHSQEIFDFAMEQELMVAGCFRAVDDEEAFHRLMDSQMALEALSKCISCSCFEIVAVPQIQVFLECRFLGYSSSLELELSRREPTRFFIKGLWANLLKIVLLPVVAVFPPLSDLPGFRYQPALRYALYEGMTVVYYFLVVLSSYNIFREGSLGIRDWGLLAWTAMLLGSQLQCVFLMGVANFFSDKGNIVDIVAYVGVMTSLMLNVCHGDDSFLSSAFPNQCGDSPPRVPTAAVELLSVSVLMLGFRLMRVLTLHPSFGPLIMAVNSMSRDIAQWVSIVSFIIVAFAGAFHILYGDSFKDPLRTTPDGCFAVDSEFDEFPNALTVMIEMMLNADGQYDCFRYSAHPNLGVLYSYLMVLMTSIVLVNMLVALITKTYDEITANLTKSFMFVRSRIICEWLKYPAVPPPLNILSIPFLLVKGFLQLLVLYGRRVNRPTSPVVLKSEACLTWMNQWTKGTDKRRATLPKSWHSNLGDDPVTALASKIEEFAIENSSEDMQKAKFQESVYDKLDTMNKELKEMDQRHRQALDDIKNLLGQAVSRVSI